MIPENFYPVVSSYGCGATQNEFTDTLTNGIHMISDFMTNKCNAYWLGYISKDNLPMAFRYSMATFDTDNGFIFREATDEDNFPCGYCTGNKRTGSYNSTPEYEVNQAYSDGAVCPSNYAHISLFNSLHPEYSGYGNYIGTDNHPHLVFRCYLYDSNDNLVAVRNDEFITFTYKDLYDFLNGENSATLTVSGHSVVLTSDDLETGTCYKETSDNYFVRLFLVNYNFSCRSVLNGSYEAPTVLPSFMVHTTFNDGQWSGMFFGNQGVCIGDGQIARVLNNDVQWSYYWWSYYGGARAGLDGQIAYDDYIELRNNGSTYGFLYDNNVLLAKSGSDYIFYPIFPIAEVKKHFSLMYRVDVSANGDTTSYVFGLSYATDVSETNEFLARLKTGNITNQAFKDSLRPWQYSNIAVNEFTKDDVPPYTPTPPGPGNDDEEYGDSIDNQYRGYGASKFITQYALTRTQLELFGEKLWTSWADTLGNPTDMWKNFKMFIGGGGDTGSIDISTALDFIISLRVFPYDLTNTIMKTDVNGIRLGRGEYPIDVGTVKKLYSLIQYVDFGSITVPRPFGDYRDYENMNISLVLPYCGTTQLNPGDVIGRTLTCTYAVDLQSGTCSAFVWVTATGDKGEHHYNVAEMSGQIGALLPVSATNSGQIMSQRISDAASVASTIAAPINEAGMLDALMGSKDPDLSNATNISPLFAIVDPNTYKSISAVAGALSRPAIACPSLGGGSGLAAFHQPASPYIQLRYGMYTEPSNYKHSTGYPSTKSATLSNYSGYVVCSNVDVSTLTCHTDEKAVIKAALESGVYV